MKIQLANGSTPSMPMKMCRTVLDTLTRRPLLVGISIRLVLMILLPLLLDDGILLQGVKYTDIDYDVFTDAAAHVKSGDSPFRRHTYRYTPFLAMILSWAEVYDVNAEHSMMKRWVSHSLKWWRHPRYFGRLLFCIADALCGLVILHLRRKERKNAPINDDSNREPRGLISVELQDSLWWLLNPLPINICTRGSAESFVVLMPVLATLAIATSCSKTITKKNVMFRAAVAGILHGLAIHAKLYPVIYTVSYMAHFSFREQSIEVESGHGSFRSMTPSTPDKDNAPVLTNVHENVSTNKSNFKSEHELYPFPWFNPKRLVQLILLWIRRLFFTPSSIIFASFFILTFGTLTFLAVHLYGEEALQEGLTYHFSRVDHRHNYSMFWYWIYLARGRSAVGGSVIAAAETLSIMGRALLLPQALLLIYSSLGIAPHDLPFALFLQTFLFVTHNKVFTAQYFTWYLCLLPLCSNRIRWKTYTMIGALCLLGFSIVLWLGSAFFLEMKGLPVHLQVWMASIGFFICNVNLFRQFLVNYKGTKQADITNDLGIGLRCDNAKKDE